MMQAAIPASAFALLSELDANNNRTWFEAHRARLRDEVQEPFVAVLEAVADALSDAEPPLKGGRQTIFRMNRDIRFSADKRPYKAHASGLLTPSGAKEERAGVLYLHMGPEGGFVAAGFYNLSPTALAPLRDRIVADPARFRATLDALAEAGQDLAREPSLKAPPRGYAAHADMWFADYLKLKGFTTETMMPKEDWISGQVVERAAAHARGAAPLLAFGAPDQG